MGSDNSIIRGTLPSGRLDQALSEALPDISRQRLKALILRGAVRIGGSIATDPSDRKSEGKEFHIDIPPPVSADAIAQHIPLNVVYEDADLIVIDKQAGLVVHPAPGHPDGTLVNALLHHCRGQLSGIGGVERPGIVHRIDRDTSGLILAAKNDRAHEGLARQFKAHDIERRYIALVHGNPVPPAGTVRTHIGRSSRDRRKMDPCDENRGKLAITHYHVIRNAVGASEVHCRLETGRTHQVRVHMAHLGHPLIGDPLYEGRQRHGRTVISSGRFARQALHAAELGFIHPSSGEKMLFESEIPADMQELFSNIFV